MREKRRFERVSSRLRCWCEGEDVTFYARVGDLSEGGLFLRTFTPLRRGTRTRLRFQALGEPELAVSATVMWSRQDDECGAPGMGLAFDALDAETYTRIRLLLARERSAAAAAARSAALVVGAAGV